jgi:hypothetical protein
VVRTADYAHKERFHGIVILYLIEQFSQEHDIFTPDRLVCLRLLGIADQDCIFMSILLHDSPWGKYRKFSQTVYWIIFDQCTHDRA